MILFTNRSKGYLYLFFEGLLASVVFRKINVPEGDDHSDLMHSVQYLLNEDKEVNAENIFLHSKNHKIVALYMDIVNNIDKKKLGMTYDTN